MHWAAQSPAGTLKLQVTGLGAAQVGTNNCTETWLGPGVCDLRLAAHLHIILTVGPGTSVYEVIIPVQFALTVLQ